MLFLKSLSIELKSSKHRSATINSYLLLKYSFWNGERNSMISRFFCAINAQCNMDPAAFATLDYSQEIG